MRKRHGLYICQSQASVLVSSKRNRCGLCTCQFQVKEAWPLHLWVQVKMVGSGFNVSFIYWFVLQEESSAHEIHSRSD